MKTNLILTACVLLSATHLAAQQESLEVYYQVTYRGGKTVDLSSVPLAPTNIDRVIRITRYGGLQGGTQVLSTNEMAPLQIGGGKTVKIELTWNGQAWVAPEPPAGDLAGPNDVRSQNSQELAEAESVLDSLGKRLGRQELALDQAEQLLKTASPASADAARQAANAARAERDKTLQIIQIYSRHVDLLRSSQADQPSGQLLPKAPPAGHPQAANQPGSDLAKPAVPQYRSQLTALPPGQGERQICVSMPHAEAGSTGSFSYIAYSDSDGDGQPDTPIARSQPAKADAPMDWSRWTFTTAEPRVYVGAAWNRADTTLPLQQLQEPQEPQDVQAPVGGNGNYALPDVYVSYFPSAQCDWKKHRGHSIPMHVQVNGRKVK